MMKKKWVKGLFILLAISIFLLKIGIEKKIKEVKEFPVKEVVEWLGESHPEEALIGGILTALGFKELLVDFLFLQSIQYFGDWSEKKEVKFQKTYPLFRVMGLLDPHFVEAYSFGALVMEETGHINTAIIFLNEGIENNPYAFRLWIYRDFIIRLFRTYEYSRAIEGIKQAIQLKGHPPILERILAFAYEKNGQIKEAILQWKRVFLEEANPRVKEIASSNVKRLLKILREREGEEEVSFWWRKNIAIEGLKNDSHREN